LFFEFPTNQELFSVDAQWLVGRDILITPVLQPNVSTVTGYFPTSDGSQWRDWYTHELINTTDSGNVTLDAPLSHLNVHLRSGSAVLLYAEPKYTVKETSDGPYELLVFLRQDGTAEGTAYFDDGETYPPADSKDLRFSVHDSQLEITSLGQTGAEYSIPSSLGNVTVLGVPSSPATVQVQGQSVQFTYDAGLQRLVVDGVNTSLNDDVKVQWS
jgi:alpha-glucosidase